VGTGEKGSMTEREADTDIMMRLPEQSLELARGFKRKTKQSLYLLFSSTSNPKNSEPAAQRY
jgi:hypothetical protein